MAENTRRETNALARLELDALALEKADARAEKLRARADRPLIVGAWLMGFADRCFPAEMQELRDVVAELVASSRRARRLAQSGRVEVEGVFGGMLIGEVFAWASKQVERVEVERVEVEVEVEVERVEVEGVEVERVEVEGRS